MSNLPEIWSIDRAVKFYGWEGLAPSTQKKRFSVLKRYGLLGQKKPTKPKLPSHLAHNTRQTDAIILNKTFGFDFPVAPYIPHRYVLPDEETIALAGRDRHGIYVLLMAYAGLRIGEACACDHSWLEGNALVVRANMGDDHIIRRTKTGKVGRVVLPDWLVTEVLDADFSYPNPKALRKWCSRRGITPHSLRHFYATLIVRETQNIELARRQLRHSKIETTLGIYLEVEAGDAERLVSTIARPQVTQRYALKRGGKGHRAA
jgi:integrase